MRLCRYYNSDEVKTAVMNKAGQLLDVSFFGEDFNDEFFATDGINRLKEWLGSHRELLEEVPPPYRLAPPFFRPSKIICVGLNYREHAAEVSAAPPREPILFFKSNSAISGCNDPVWRPPGCDKLDYEVELGVVIGTAARCIEKKEAMEYIAGYVLTNDYSERSFQLEHKGQWVKGKSHDSFAPFGPFLATKDEIKNPHKLSIWLEVNGEKRQQSSTSSMIFDIPYLISYISKFMTLLPGDVICTGTPSGVGMGYEPPRFLRPGDRVTYGIENLGSTVQIVQEMPNDAPMPFSPQTTVAAAL